MTAAAHRSRNLAVLARLDDRHNGVIDTGGGSVAEIHAARAERDAQLGGGDGPGGGR